MKSQPLTLLSLALRGFPVRFADGHEKSRRNFILYQELLQSLGKAGLRVIQTLKTNFTSGNILLQVAPEQLASIQEHLKEKFRGRILDFNALMKSPTIDEPIELILGG